MNKEKHSHRPPWMKDHDWKSSRYGDHWQKGFDHFSKDRMEQRRKMGRRFLGVFLFVGLSVLSAGIILGLVIGGNQELLGSKDLRRLLFCLVPFLVPVAAMILGRLGMRRWVNPLADVMSAAESLSEGDFSVRVKEEGDREFTKLARSFNHMAAELEHAELQRRNLTADVAHELRTPLHILQGNLEGALDGVYEASPDYFRSMLEETRLLQRLVEDLQTLSMAESGTLDFDFQKLSLKDLLADVVTSFSPGAEEAGIELVLEVIPENEIEVEGDWQRLDQVLGNLVQNAMRYTPEGGRIELSLNREEDLALITVKDSGEGISAEDLPYIFDRFWKGDKSRSRASGGSGLGLAIARQLVTTQGGTIEVESREGEGTTFTVRLPAAEESNQDD